MSLLTVGTVAFDDIETPLGRAEMAVGGAATYISLAASYFVKGVQVVSVIGDDFPKETLENMSSRQIDLSGVQIKSGERSFFWAGKYSKSLNERTTLDTQLNVLADFDPILPEAYKRPKFVMLGNLVPDIQIKVIDQLLERPKLIALDTMNYWMDNAWNSLQRALKLVDALIINDEEARQLSGEYSLVRAAKAIHSMGPLYLIIKKGEHGALLFDHNPRSASHGKIFFAPALPLADVYDPTGAGDTFAGGFMGYMAKSGDISFDNMKRAIIYGSALASFCVEKFSILRLLELTQEDIQERVQEFVNLVHFEM